MWIAYTRLRTSLIELHEENDQSNIFEDKFSDSLQLCFYPTPSEILSHTLDFASTIYSSVQSIVATVIGNEIPRDQTSCNASTWAGLNPAVTAFLMLHLLLSHMSYRTLYDALKRGTLRGFPYSLASIKLSELPACEIDRLAKSHVNPKSGFPRFRADAPGLLWHSDLKGPFRVKSIRGYHYWMTFIDDFTGYCFIYFLRYKSDALICGLKRFITEVLLPIGIQFCKLVHDPGGEYSGYAFQKFCYEHGVKPEPIPAKNAHYNGVAENKNKVLAAGLRSTRLYAKLPAYLWCCIVETVNDMLNLTPKASAAYTTAYFRWHGVHPSIANLHVIGAECYLHDPNFSSSSSANPSEIVRFLGYVHHSYSTYRLWRPRTGKLIESNHVTFITTPLKLVSPYDIKYIATDDTLYDDSIEFATVEDEMEFEKNLMHAKNDDVDNVDERSHNADSLRRSVQQEMMSHSATEDSNKRMRTRSSSVGGWPPSQSTSHSRMIEAATPAPSVLRTNESNVNRMDLPIALRREKRTIVTPGRLLLNMLSLCFASMNRLLCKMLCMICMKMLIILTYVMQFLMSQHPSLKLNVVPIILSGNKQ